MCGRYGFVYRGKKYFEERFDLSKVFDLDNSYNVSPTHKIPVVERHSPNSLHLREWGIKPSWSKMLLINAQASKLATSKVWSRAFRENRVIIPASFFYEWKRLDDGKQPFLIQLKNKEMMGFAGLLVTYKSDKGEEKEGVVIITTEPNELMEKIHNRMPVILRREDEDDWLNPDITEPKKLEKILSPYPTDEMEAYPISSQVNSPKNNYPEITNPIK